eukprot:SAG11_NODE_31405_length_292_cov_0.756477_1_plen_66_part_10
MGCSGCAAGSPPSAAGHSKDAAAGCGACAASSPPGAGCGIQSPLYVPSPKPKAGIEAGTQHEAAAR